MDLNSPTPDQPMAQRQTTPILLGLRCEAPAFIKLKLSAMLPSTPQARGSIAGTALSRDDFSARSDDSNPSPTDHVGQNKHHLVIAFDSLPSAGAGGSALPKPPGVGQGVQTDMRWGRLSYAGPFCEIVP